MYSSSDRSFAVNVTNTPTANCVMKIGAYDVDYPGPANPEDDEVFLNGNFVMRLVGQSTQDSETTASFNCSRLHQGSNDLAVKVMNKDWLVTLKYISISGDNLAGTIGEVGAGGGRTHWESVHILNADGSPYKPVPKTDLLIFSIGDASWRMANPWRMPWPAIRWFLIRASFCWKMDCGYGYRYCRLPRSQGRWLLWNGGYRSPRKAAEIPGTAAYVQPAGAKRELHCNEFSLRWAHIPAPPTNSCS